MSKNDHPEALHDAARRYLAAGLSVLPARKDQKRPTVRSWKPFQTRLPTDSEVDAWFAGAPSAVCVLCGKVSGNLELIDFDQGGALFGPWCERLEAAAPGLLERLALARTQSGGRHAAYRCEVVISGNLKLAEGRDDGGRPVTLIETRGEGGLFLCPPTDGYAFLQGDLADLPVVTEDERDVLLGCAWELDEGPPPGGGADTGGPSAKGADISAHGANRAALSADRAEVSAEKPHSGPVSADHAACEPENAPGRQTIRTSGREVAQAAGVGGQCGQSAENSDPGALSADNAASPPENGLRPGDDFNRRGDVRAILQKHGWVLVKPGENEYWRRPGKDSGSASATLKGGTFYNFSLNAHPFKPRESYSPFSVYALLEHGGDFEQAARALRQLGYGSDPSDHGVDLSHLLAVPADSGDCPPEKPDIPDPGPIPERLFEVPGFVARVMDFTLASAPYPNVGLAFSGAMALLSYLTGRKVCDEGDLRTNLYLLALASSGTGKDFPRKVNARVLFEIGHAGALGDKFASGEGIQDALLRNGAMLFQNDEMDGVLRQINLDRENRRESIPNVLMTVFTSANDFYPVRVKANQKEAATIDQPHLVLFGTATPQYFYEALSQRMLTNGFFARLIIVDIGQRGEGQEPRPARNVPDAVLDIARWWADYNPHKARRNLLEVHPEPKAVRASPEAKEALTGLQRATETEYRQADEQNDEVARVAWSRTHENAKKLSLLRAVSENHEAPLIDLPAVEWATAFAMHQTRRQLFLAQTYVAENAFHAECLKLIRKLRDAPGHELPHSVLLKRMKMNATAFRDLVETLRQRGEVLPVHVTTAGRAGVAYRLVGVKEGERW